MPTLTINLLGPFECRLGEQTITNFRTRAVQALLIYLVCEAERPHSREALMELLWPGMPLTSAQSNLRQTVYRLRQLIPEVAGRDGEASVPFLESSRRSIQVNPAAAVTADVHTFQAAASTNWQQAIDLYRGEFLTDFYLPESEAFEGWAAGWRAAVRQQMLDVLERQAMSQLEQGNYPAAVQLARQQLVIDNLRESGHRQLIEAWARSGRRQDALDQFEQLRQLLRNELALEPEPQTLALIDAVRAGELLPLSNGGLGPNENDDPPEPTHNLPQRLASFIGREKEMAEVTKLVREHRLVMLTGVGGIGKTDLSLQVARNMVDEFPDGVWLVEFAAVSDPQLVAQTAAYALGLRADHEQSDLDILRDCLSGWGSLLIFDNCEHLIDSVAQVATAILQVSPRVKILASSREILSVPGEVPYRVPSMSIPTADYAVGLDEWPQYEALHLFVERAQVALPTFTVTTENIAYLAKICRRLDGIPLAVELAAARVTMLTLPQIAARLDDRFRLLTGGNRTALPRQQTLRALIDWSWDLLPPADQLLLQRLAVFAGGFQLEAAEAVCHGEGLEQLDILELLTELVNKSLVVARRKVGYETRYFLLETIRQYATVRLVESGGVETYRHNHLNYYLQLSEQAAVELVAPNQIAWMNKLEADFDNIRAALSWASETDAEAGLRLASGLWKFWEARGYLREGDEAIRELLSKPAAVDPLVRADALDVQASFNLTLFNLQLAREFEEESLAIFRSHQVLDRVARGLHHLAILHSQLGEPEVMQPYLDESLELHRALENKLGLADLLGTIGIIQGNSNNLYEDGIKTLIESKILYKELGHVAGIASVLNSLGMLGLRRGDYEAARSWLEEGQPYFEQLEGAHGSRANLIHFGELYYRLGDLEKSRHYLGKSVMISKRLGENLWRNWAIVRLGYLCLVEGDFREAHRLFGLGLNDFHKAGNGSGVIFAAEGLASWAVLQEEPEMAARLFTWADVQRVRTDDPRPPSEQADVDHYLALIREIIDEETMTTAAAEGQRLSVEEITAWVEQND